MVFADYCHVHPTSIGTQVIEECMACIQQKIGVFR